MIEDLYSHVNICELYVFGVGKLEQCLQFTSLYSCEIM